MTDLSIILVNWNCIRFTEQSLASIHETVEGISYEVIVVDNASTDFGWPELQSRYPSVKIVLSQANLGFGGANNLGATMASGRILFFLNPDTILLKDAVLHAYQTLADREDAGVVGCRFLNPDGSLQLSSVQAFPSVLNQAFAFRWLQQRFPSLQGKRALFGNRSGKISTVDVVSGAGLMIRDAVFARVGGFSKEYFMYAEEVELCYAVRQAGWKVLHCGAAEIIHFGGQSTGQCSDGFQDIAMRRSVHYFLQRRKGTAAAWFYRAALFGSAALRIVLLSIALRILNVSRRKRAADGLRKWRRIARWAMTQEQAQPMSAQAVLENASASS